MKTIQLAIIFLLLTSAANALAETADSEPNKASDASFDKRLPPVLPGEEVKDSGKKMKVWSTSGPVPVAQPPEPWKGTIPPGLGIIVDQRKDHHSDREKDHAVDPTGEHKAEDSFRRNE